MELKFDQKDTRIYFHPEHCILHLKWSGINDSALYLDALLALKKLNIDYEVTGWLFDISKAQTMPELPLENYLNYLVDVFKKGNLKKYSRVISQDQAYESRIISSLNLLKDAYGLKVEIANFKTEPEALAWLFNASIGTLDDG